MGKINSLALVSVIASYGILVLPCAGAAAVTELDAYFKKKADLGRSLEMDWRGVPASEANSAKGPHYTKVVEHERKAMAEMATLLRALLGEPAFKTTGATTSFEPALTQGNMDWGCLDSLHYHFGGPNPMSVVVTDIEILDRLHVKIDLKNLIEKEITDIACDDSAYTIMGRMKSPTPGAFDEAQAFLTLNAQDDGPLGPNKIVVFTRKGTRIQAAFKLVDVKTTDIERCQKEYMYFGKFVACVQNSFASDEATMRPYARQAAEILDFLRGT